MVKLSLKKINLHYDNDFHAVKDVSLDINESEIVTLLGPSGCGKTSILRTIAGFNTPSSGEIFLNGEDITTLPAQKRNMGMIFQNYALWPHMKIKDNIGYGLKIRKMDKEVITEKTSALLKQVKLEGQEEKFPTQLSGGQQQRVALARAVAIEPTVLLCDEPLSNLDYKLRVELRTEIREIAKTLGITVIYVTHDQTEALAISDRIAIIDEGVIIQIGTPIQIYNDPDTMFVATFIGENNVLTGIVKQSDKKQTIVTLNSGEDVSVNIAEELSKGDKVKLLTRFDSVSINSELGENKLKGKIKNKFYMGSFIQIEIELQDGTIIVTNETENIEELDSMSAGDDIIVRLESNDLLVFKNDLRVR